MTDPRGVHSAHLDAETIAALVDRALDPAARAAAEAHLADCADCREVWVETSELANGESADAEVINTDTAPAPSRSRRWIYAGAGLAAAAAIALAVFTPQLFDRGDRPELRELVEAVGTNRRTEGRLTGGFAWGPIPRATRSQDEASIPASVEAAAVALRVQAEDERNAKSLAALGTAQLVMHRFDSAIEAMEASLELDSSNARVWSDLATAYLERSKLADREMDIPRALQAAEEALRRVPTLPEAQFNRALALSKLGLTAEALSAWEAYARSETHPRWRQEADVRVRELRNRASKVGLDAQAIREQVFDVGFVRWAQDSESNPSRATRGLQELQQQADLVRDIGDALVDDALQEIRVASVRRRSLLAAVHQRYGIAREAYRNNNLEVALHDFTRIRGASIGGPLPLLAALHEGIILYRLGSYRIAEETLTQLATQFDAMRYPSLAGRIAWTRGLIAGVQGHLGLALGHYEKARNSLSRAQEPRNVAFIEGLQSTVYDRLGDGQKAWKARIAALSSTDREGTLLAAAESCHRLRWVHVARWLQLAALARAEEANRIPNAIDALRALVHTEHVAGQPLGALDHLEHGERLLASLPEGAVADRLKAELQLARSTLLAPSEPVQALASANEAFDYFDATNAVIRQPEALLARSRVHRAQGSEALARADLERAFRIYEHNRQTMGPGEAKTLVVFSDLVRDLAHELASLEIAEGRPGRALAALDRARAPDYAAPRVQNAGLRLPNGVVGLFFHSGPEHLWAWAVKGGDVTFAERHVERSQLESIVDSALRGESPALERLRTELLAPFDRLLETGELLVIVPDGPLHRLSFGAMPGKTSAFLIEEHPIVLASGLSAWLALADGNAFPLPPEKALVVGNPRRDPGDFPDLTNLPGAEREARSVSAVYTQAHLLIGGDATLEAMTSGAANADVIHFAGHAILNEAVPGNSRLVIAGRDRSGLAADDIRGLSLNRTRLVVLAACRTAAGVASESEGSLGLARAFLEAGAGTVVAGLWPLDDAASERLFATFHRTFALTGDAARALQTAQVLLIRSGEGPRNWAGVVAIGLGTIPTKGRKKHG